MNSWKIILATILIFGAGVITGGMLVNHVNQTNLADSSRTAPIISLLSTNIASTNSLAHQPMVGMEQRRLEFMGKVSKDLDLSSEQKNRIETIIHQQQDEIRKIWDPVWESISPRLREQMTNAHNQIVAQLTPEQRLKFEELMKRSPPRRDDSTNRPPKKVSAPLDSQSKSNIVAPLGTPPSQNP
ncbi:MAG TPA: hypothetical protein VH255_10205 [Verrucomicrobiae bacterium]|nr:hypothetical protein [Verrucomicrobiae bacterium]